MAGQRAEVCFAGGEYLRGVGSALDGLQQTISFPNHPVTGAQRCSMAGPTRDTGRLSGPRHKGDWEGLGAVVAVLVAVHVAALLFWIVSLIRSSLQGSKVKKADLKQH